jgi:Ferritin-like domain
MNVDDGALEAPIGESNTGCPRSVHPPDLDRFCRTLIERRRLLKAGGFGLAILMSGGLLRKPLGSAVAAMVRPRSIQSGIEVQMFQTAASLENLAVATYAVALELPFVQENAVILQFIETTMQHHSEHGALFNAQAESLGGVRQDAPNPKYSQFVEATVPTLTDAAGVVGLAATLEEVATDTYLANLTLLPNAARRTLMASVMGVESQHLATLQTFSALIAADVPELVAIPTDLAALPAAAGSVAFPLALELANFASPPTEGAVR